MAGADLIRTNTYQASRPGYEKYLGMTREECEKTFQRTIGLAFQAKQEFMESGQGQGKGDIRVLASIGPYGAWLSDGSEYSGCYGDTVPVDVIKHFHKERLDVILRCGVDALAIETIPVLKEAEIIVDLLNEFHPKVPFWVSFSCKVGREFLIGFCSTTAIEINFFVCFNFRTRMLWSMERILRRRWNRFGNEWRTSRMCWPSE